jgi:hypothetical protein
MQTDPVAEWQRLTEFYREKSDEALEELGEDFGNLTETAQQVLTTEMRSRGLSLPGSNPQPASYQIRAPGVTRSARSVDPFGLGSNISDNVVDEENDCNDSDADEDIPREFTWKTILCEVNDSAEARLLREALYRAGIESWVDNRAAQMELGAPRILVAADQLEAAQAVAAQPIPQDILQESQEAAPEYEPPSCPECHTEDPVLESADPSNNWLCEACGAIWSDPLPDSDLPPAQSSK